MHALLTNACTDCTMNRKFEILYEAKERVHYDEILSSLSSIFVNKVQMKKISFIEHLLNNLSTFKKLNEVIIFWF